ncbi:MAG: hypothetical protein AAF598_01690 [Bacteroidota bacterium]
MNKALFLLLMFFPLAGWAHSPNETNYTLAQDEAGWTMTVHFTPLSAIRILEKEGVIQPNQAQVQPLDQADALTHYFNQHVQLHLNQQAVHFVWQDAHFGGHDAWIKFGVMNAPAILRYYDCQITAFNTIFRKPINVLMVKLDQEIATCVMNAQNTHCQSGFLENSSPYASLNYWSFGLVISMIFVALLWVRLVFKAEAVQPTILAT